MLYTNRAKAFVFRGFGGSRKRSILGYVMTESSEGVVSPTMREVMRSVSVAEPLGTRRLNPDGTPTRKLVGILRL
ncbi:hypothetical protein [Listeria booriae]|nr:hypothetical protein [Listeria booriae]